MSLPIGWRPPPPAHWDDLTLTGRQRLHAAICAIAAERDELLASGATTRAVPLGDEDDWADVVRQQARAIQASLPPEPPEAIRRRRRECGGQQDQRDYSLAELAEEYRHIGMPLPRDAAPRLGLTVPLLEKRLTQARAAGLLPPSPHSSAMRYSA